MAARIEASLQQRYECSSNNLRGLERRVNHMAVFNGQLRIPDGVTSFLNGALILLRNFSPPALAQAAATKFLIRPPRNFRNGSPITVIGDSDGSVIIMDDARPWVAAGMAPLEAAGAKKAGAKKAGAKKAGAKKAGAKKAGAKKAGAKKAGAKKAGAKKAGAKKAGATKAGAKKRR
jgi:hypothetical protein